VTAGATVGDSGQETGAEKHPVVLTAHPLQRAGAFALAAIAGAPYPERISEQALREAASAMEQDLQKTAGLASSREPGGFWLEVSQLFWPNAKALAHPSRGGLSAEERQAWIGSWREVPGLGQVLGVPCALCGRPASSYHGKVDVPLAASVEHRNTTARGQEGTPLCRGCLASFYALPYACAIAKGRARAAVLHSWDDDFLSRKVTSQVRRMRRRADVAAGMFGADRPYAQHVAALYEIREYSEAISAGVELLVFSNINRNPMLNQHVMDQPLASWLRRIRYDPRSADGWRYLVRAHAQPGKLKGLSVLAHDLFDQPGRIPFTAARYLRGLAAERGIPPAEAIALAGIVFDYAKKVLEMTDSDTQEIHTLAGKIATAAGHDQPDFKKFAFAARTVKDLKHWLRTRAIGVTLYSRDQDAFVTERQWRLLFDSGYDSSLNRDLLLIAVLERVHGLSPAWREDDPAARQELDDEFGNDGEEPEE
jgi:hypothetical protein